MLFAFLEKLLGLCGNRLEWGKPGGRAAIWKPVMVTWVRDKDSLNSLVSVRREDLDSRGNPCFFAQMVDFSC